MVIVKPQPVLQLFGRWCVTQLCWLKGVCIRACLCVHVICVPIYVPIVSLSVRPCICLCLSLFICVCVCVKTSWVFPCGSDCDCEGTEIVYLTLVGQEEE